MYKNINLGYQSAVLILNKKWYSINKKTGILNKKWYSRNLFFHCPHLYVVIIWFLSYSPCLYWIFHKCTIQFVASKQEDWDQKNWVSSDIWKTSKFLLTGFFLRFPNNMACLIISRVSHIHTIISQKLVKLFFYLWEAFYRKHSGQIVVLVKEESEWGGLDRLLCW